MSILTRTQRNKTVEQAPEAPQPAPDTAEGDTTPEPQAPQVDLSDEPLRARTPKPGKSNIQAWLDNIIVDSEGTWAWFLMGEVPWLCIDADKAAMAMGQFAHRLASFTGRTIEIRSTSSPFDWHGWAVQIDKDNPAPPPAGTPRGKGHYRLPSLDGDEKTGWFNEKITRTQHRMIERGFRTHAVALAVRLTKDRLTEDQLLKVIEDVPLTKKEVRFENLRRELASITVEVAKEGINGRPLEQSELTWLMQASMGMGAPVPAMLARGDHWRKNPNSMSELVYATADPAATSTTVRTIRGAEQITSHVSTLFAVDNVVDLSNTSGTPFLAWTQTRPYGVEIVARFDLLPGSKTRRQAEFLRRKGQSIAKHHEEHDDDPPAQIARGIELARQFEDEVNNGDRVTAVRAYGWILLAVAGETETEAKHMANDLIAAAAEERNMTLVLPFGQYEAYRAFTPGQPMPVREGLDTQMKLPMLAAAVPHASTEAGDTHGYYVGTIRGSHAPFLLDPVGGPSNDKSGVQAAIGSQGSGKSSLGGFLAAESASLGNRTVVNDPSGLMKRLVEVSYLRDSSRHLDLFDCLPGTLTPSMLIPEPNADHYEKVESFEAAVRDAGQERMSLTIDALRNLIPYQVITGSDAGRMVAAIRQAVTNTGDHFGMDPWDVLDDLRGQGDTGLEVAAMLETAAKLRGGRLIFPERGALKKQVDGDYLTSLMEQAVLTVVTMKGLSISAQRNADRATWNEDQQQAVPLLDLAARFSTRVLYFDTKQKCIVNDELGLTGGAAGGAFARYLARSSVDSRKWNGQIILLGQNPSMFTKLDDEIANLLGQVWIGRLDQGVAAAALPLVGLKVGCGFEEIFASLMPGEFLVRDWNGRHPIVRVDRSVWPDELVKALETNPNAGRNAPVYKRRLGVAV